MHNLNILSAIKMMITKKMQDFIFENYYRRTRFTKENSYYLMKHQKKNDLLLLGTNLKYT